MSPPRTCTWCSTGATSRESNLTRLSPNYRACLNRQPQPGCRSPRTGRDERIDQLYRFPDDLSGYLPLVHHARGASLVAAGQDSLAAALEREVEVGSLALCHRWRSLCGRRRHRTWLWTRGRCPGSHRGGTSARRPTRGKRRWATWCSPWCDVEVHFGWAA